MNINITLFGEMITFAIFVWFTYSYVWPPITKAMDARQEKIAKGISDAEKAERYLEETKKSRENTLLEAEEQARLILKEAKVGADKIISQAREEAKKQQQHILQLAEKDAAQQMIKAKEHLLKHVTELTMQATQKILKKEIDVNENQDLIAKTLIEGN